MTTIYIYIKQITCVFINNLSAAPKLDSNQINLEQPSQATLTSTRFPSTLGMGNYLVIKNIVSCQLHSSMVCCNASLHVRNNSMVKTNYKIELNNFPLLSNIISSNISQIYWGDKCSSSNQSLFGGYQSELNELYRM